MKVLHNVPAVVEADLQISLAGLLGLAVLPESHEVSLILFFGNSDRYL